MKPDNRFDTYNGEHRFEWDSDHRIEPVFEMTKAYVDELEASVEYLRNENIDWEDKYRELADRYNKLRELLSSYWKRVHSPAAPNVERDYLAEMRTFGIEVGKWMA